MDTAPPAATWVPYQARPGRPTLVIDDLADLRGPASGEVVLPLRLFWSPAGRTWDLGNRYDRRAPHQTLLNEANRARALAQVPNSTPLVPVWPGRYLRKGARRAWEERRPRLRAARAAAA